MRKVLKVCMAGIVSASMLGACSFGKKEEPRNGALLIGEEQPLKEIANQHKNEIKSNDLFKVKRTETDGKQVLIMNQKTAENVVEKGILRESDNARDLNSSNPITSLPTVPKGKAVMFTNPQNKTINKITVNNKKINVQYESNTWFGHERTSKYEDIILILDNTTFEEVPATETFMEILHFNKSYGEDKVYSGGDVKAVQAWNEWEKLTKGMVKQVNTFDIVSITKE